MNFIFHSEYSMLEYKKQVNLNLNLNNKDNLSEISKQIVDILVNLISKEFDDYHS